MSNPSTTNLVTVSQCDMDKQHPSSDNATFSETHGGFGIQGGEGATREGKIGRGREERGMCLLPALCAGS